MANAPQFTEDGKEPTTLVPIKGIYRTKEEAQSKAATTIHVERGLAKVTVGSSTTADSKDYFAKDGDNVTGKNIAPTRYKSQNGHWMLLTRNHSQYM